MLARAQGCRRQNRQAFKSSCLTDLLRQRRHRPRSPHSKPTRASNTKLELVISPKCLPRTSSEKSGFGVSRGATPLYLAVGHRNLVICDEAQLAQLRTVNTG